MNEFDLHMHSNYSGDGQFTPAELIGIAKERGLKTIALSDHDCISGVKEMIKLGKEAGIEVIPAIECSTSIGYTDVHLLGYGIDVDDVFVQLFRMFEICKFHHHVAHGLTAARHHFCKRKGFRPDDLNIVVVNADEDILYFIGELVNALAEQHDVLALNGRDEGLYQGVQQSMLFFIRRVLYGMYLLQLLGKLGRGKVLHRLLQQMGCLARKLRAGNEIFKIEGILFF